MNELEVKLTGISFTFRERRRMGVLWSVSVLLTLFVSCQEVQSRRIDTLAQSFVIQAQPDSSSSSFFRRNLGLQKKSINPNQQDYLLEGRSTNEGEYDHIQQQHIQNNNRYSYFHNDEDDDQPLGASGAFPQQFQPHKNNRRGNSKPSSSNASKFTTALLTRSNINSKKNPKLPPPTSSPYSSYKAKPQLGINRKHSSIGLLGVDDSAEENANFQHHHHSVVSAHYDDEEDPHLHQERFKSSQYFNTKDGDSDDDDDNNDKTKTTGLLNGGSNDEDDEASSELGRYSLVNSYFDNEYSLKRLHEMECVTPTKSKGYCSTFRACVPSLFTANGELEAPALAELISFSIGYCTMNSNIAENSNVLMKRAGHRFAEAPPASGGEPSAEESAEKFNDFLANKGPEVGSFDEDDEGKISGGGETPSDIVTSGESVIWSSKEKKPTPIKTIQTSVKVTTEPPQQSSEEEINEPNNNGTEEDKDNKISSIAPAINTVQDEPVSDDGDGSSHSIYTDDKAATAETALENESSSQEQNALPVIEGQLDASFEVSYPGEIPIEAFKPPGSSADEFKPIFPPDSDNSDGSSYISHSPIEESQQQLLQNDPTDEETISTQPPEETSTIISIISSTASSSRKNSSFIQIQPEPVVGANGKFTLENGVHIEKATSATPRPKPNPAHQTTIGETTVNIIKTEIPVVGTGDPLSNNKHPAVPTKPYSSKIPSTSNSNSLNVNSHHQQHSQLINEDNEYDKNSDDSHNEANDFPKLETTTISSFISSSESATTHRTPDMWDDSINVDAIRETESELQSTTTQSESDRTTKPVGLLGESSSDGSNDHHPESTIAPSQQDESFQDETLIPSTTTNKVYSSGQDFQDNEGTTKSSSDGTESSTYLSPDVLVDSQDNSIANDESQTVATSTIKSVVSSSEEESSTGSYDINNNPPTTPYEIPSAHDDQLTQTTIPAGHYFQDEMEKTTTSIPVDSEGNDNDKLVSMQTNLFDNSGDDHHGQEHFNDEETSTSGSLYPTTHVLGQSDDQSPGKSTGNLQEDENETQPEDNKVNILSPNNNKKPVASNIQLFLGKEPTKVPGNNDDYSTVTTNQPFLQHGSTDYETFPTSGIPTTQTPPKIHEETSMESEYDSSSGTNSHKAPGKWSITQIHSQSNDRESNFGSGESNELHQADSVGSSEEEKTGSSSSIEDNLNSNIPPSQIQHDNSLEESGESIAPPEVTTGLPTTVVSSSIETIQTTTTEEDLPIAPVEDEVVSTTFQPPLTSVPSHLPEATQRPPMPTEASPTSETGGINGNYKPPQDSSGEAPVPVGSQPQYHILNSCATQDYYRSLEVDLDSSTKQYPFLATIVGGSRPFCSGSLITDRHILTAAHFLSNITVSDVFHMRVHIGYRSTTSSSPGGQQETQGPFVVRKVLKVIRHKSFSFEKLVNDVAILILDRPVRFTEDVHPVCLSHSSSPYAGGDIEAFETGWVEDPLIKKISPHHPYIDEHIIKYFTFGYKNITWSLHEATTRVKSNEECAANYAFLEKSGIVIRDSMVCAAPSESKEVCTFKGNSGAPLFLSNDGKPVQIGLVSWGIGCGHFPAVFTSVSSFIPWIEKVVARTS